MKRGQFSFEHILMVLISLMIIVPGAYMFFRYSQGTESALAKAQLDSMAKNIISNSESIYYHGYPSEVVLDERMPRNIVNIEVFRNWSSATNLLLFTYSEGSAFYEYSYSSPVKILGFFDRRSWSPGIKRIRVLGSVNSSNDPYVLIDFTGDCDISITYDVDSDGLVNNNDRAVCSSAGCYNLSPSGSCLNCDYNGNCLVDNFDLLMWTSLSSGNSPPRALISGPSSASVGSLASFTANALDSENNLARVEFFRTPLNSDAPVSLGFCPSSPCTITWSPAAGDRGSHYVYTVASDSGRGAFPPISCSGTPFDLKSGNADCGAQDSIMVSVS